ncbi:MAG: IclR family transcriptional regulator [Paracoccaceae bacterium]
MANRPRRNIVQSLERGLGVLEAVSAANGPVGISELSRQLGLAKGSVARLVTTLARMNFLVRDPETRKYQLGLKLWELGSKSITGLDIRSVARPVMEELHEATGETVHLTVLSSEGKMVFLDKLDSTKSIRPNLQLGAHLPVHCVANGKAMLAFLPENQVAAILAGKLRRYTDATIIRKGELMAVVKGIRETGYAVNAGEFREDVSGVAAAICDHSNSAVAALGISLPSVRMTEEQARKLGALVAARARDISALLGNRHDEAAADSAA